jgi:hypothetical protein
MPEVEVILHPGVRHAQPNHRLELLRHGVLARIHPQVGRRESEQGRKVVLDRVECVAEADIDLHPDQGASELRLQPEAHAAIFFVGADGVPFHRLGVEDQPVVLDRRPADVLEHGPERGDGTVAEPEQVGIARHPLGASPAPDQQHQRALQDEPLAMARLGQPVEQPFDTVTVEQFDVGAAGGPRELEQLLFDRSGEVGAGLLHVTTLSR